MWLRVATRSSRSLCSRRWFGSRAIERNAGFSQVTADDMAEFARILTPAGVVTDSEKLETYNTDWPGQYRGTSQARPLHPLPRPAPSAQRTAHAKPSIDGTDLLAGRAICVRGAAQLLGSVP